MAETGASSSQVIRAAQAAIVDRTTARVAEALEREGVRCILLKGPVLERWLYEGSSRSYVDVDLLVAPDHLARAEVVLAGLGYSRALQASDIPPFDRELHADTWCAAKGPAVDLHRTLAGAAAPPAAVWAALSEDIEVMLVDDAELEVPAVAARALVVALHVAHHGAAERKPLEDLSRALELLNREGWATAAELAHRIGATEPFAAALRLLPRGRELAAALALPETSSLEVALRTVSPAPLALHLEWLRQARGPRAKLRLFLRLVFPPRAFMEPPPGTPHPRRALAAAYARRIAKLRYAPMALIAWRRAQLRRGEGVGARESRLS